MHAVAVFHLGGEGGPAHSLFPMMAELAQRGSVETIVPGDGPVAAAYAQLGPVAIARYTALTYSGGAAERARLVSRTLRDARAFRNAFRRRRPDLVIAVTTTIPAVLIAARLERIPVVLYAAEIYEQDWKRSSLLPLVGAALARIEASLASAVVCCSSAVASQFPARRGTPVVVAYPPIGASYAGGDRDAGRALLGADGADPCLLVVGAVSRGRGQDVALRALAHVRRRLPGARLVVVGAAHPRAADIAFENELRALARDLGIDGAVVFAGATAAMADVYAAADVVVNPARFAEPFGRVVPEALTAGRPVVASRVGALEEVIRPGIDGLLVDPDDPEALAREVVRLWEDAELRDRLVAAGRERVRSNFTEEHNIAAWRGVLQQVVGQRAAPV